ncbi:hypothetical protein BDW22DRAFT_1332802 [Trametopsis cervina]|nr:hypothetical protein BDW22DRAFT_1332802 [Trametopsis cervina]
MYGGDTDMGAVPTSVGILPDEVYERQMNWWRVRVRRLAGRNLQWETRVIASMQKRIRTPFLDAFFVNTSALGTHTFFMTLLPAFCFFGYQDITRGLIFVLSLGVYLSSFMKDLACSPRPFSPPVTRLSIGAHHLEYGLPSTHSTNSVSLALFFYTILYRLYTTPASAYSPPIAPSEPLLQNATHIIQDVLPEMAISQTTFYVGTAFLIFYTFSIVFGRLYTGMHSFTDCTVGVLLGAAIWVCFGQWYDSLDIWLKTAGWIVPATVVPFCLLLVHRHPEPVDDCPCFEDAIAFVSVVMGEFLTRWYMSRYGYDIQFFVTPMAGKAVGTVPEMWAWWTIAVAKMVIGILAIFAWRIFAKFISHRILPPTFRLLALLFTLPHRRYYTPATDYRSVPENNGLHPIPSVLDLPGMMTIEADGISTARDGATNGQMKNRAGRNSGSEKGFYMQSNARVGLGVGLDSEMGGRKETDVKHYDADVLTKVFVYCGIGILATGVMPAVFEVIGWGL